MYRESDASPVDRAHVERAAHPRPTWPRTLLSATLPPVIALVVQLSAGLEFTRWSLFYLAVYLSAWFGGMGSGVAATLLSFVLEWWYVIEPERAIQTNPRSLVAAIVFLLMGFLISTLQGRLRQVNNDLGESLTATRRAYGQLQEVADERRVFSALIENSADFIGLATVDGTVTYVNPAGRQLVGIAPEFPVDGSIVRDFYPPEWRERADVILRSVLEYGSWKGDAVLRHWLTGAAIPVSVTAFTIRDPEGGRFLGLGTITRDISAEKQARDDLETSNANLQRTTRELQENQRFLAAVLEYSPNGIVIKDLEGRYILANPRLQELLGVPNVTGKFDYELFPRELAERFHESDRIVRETKTPVIFEARALLDGVLRTFLISKFPLRDDDGTVFAICATWSEITERKRDEEAMQQREAEMREAQRVAHVGSWSWNLKTDVVRWSEEMYRIFGQDPSLPPLRLLSHDSQIFTPEGREKLIAAVHLLRDRGTPYDLELEVSSPDGGTRWLAARGDVVRDEFGEIVELTGTVQDVTELRELERLKEEWTSVIAHDLRQPIGFIEMAADFLPMLHSGEMDEKEKDFTHRIRSAAHSLARMVEDLTDASLLEAKRLKLDRKWVRPDELMRDSIERVAHITGQRKLRLNVERGLHEIYVDSMRIAQVLGNLISNAVKYGDPDSEIGVDLRRHDGEVEITVSNRGQGISPDELPRLFSRFRRSAKTRKSGVPGLGIGLYIAKGLVEAHGGRLWAESTPGQMTTFHVALPYEEAAQEAA